MNKDTDKIQKYLRLIAQPVRLHILLILRHGELCVCDIYEKLNLSQNLTSHHLKLLTDLQLLNRRNEGVKVLYSRNEKTISEYKRLLDNTL